MVCVTHEALRDARVELGLTRVGMAAMTDTDPTTVKRWEMDPTNKTARPAPARVTRLIQAYLAGWRPADWPQEERNQSDDPCDPPTGG